MTQGKLITIEGIDGSGKSTALGLLKEDTDWLERIGNALFEAEPSRRGVGMFLRGMLQNDDKAKLQDVHYVERLALLMAADRVEHYWDVLAPTLDAGRHVICDRYVWSSYAYQCALGVDPVFISMVNSVVAQPSLVVYIHVEPEVALKRISASREGTELFESLQNLKRIYAQYSWLLSERTGMYAVDSTPRVVIDGKLTPEAVASKIKLAVEAALKL